MRRARLGETATSSGLIFPSFPSSLLLYRTRGLFFVPPPSYVRCTVLSILESRMRPSLLCTGSLPTVSQLIDATTCHAL